MLRVTKWWGAAQEGMLDDYWNPVEVACVAFLTEKKAEITELSLPFLCFVTHAPFYIRTGKNELPFSCQKFAQVWVAIFSHFVEWIYSKQFYHMLSTFILEYMFDV